MESILLLDQQFTAFCQIELGMDALTIPPSKSEHFLLENECGSSKQPIATCWNTELLLS